VTAGAVCSRPALAYPDPEVRSPLGARWDKARYDPKNITWT